jgi:hypothetical protein
VPRGHEADLILQGFLVHPFVAVVHGDLAHQSAQTRGCWAPEQGG